MMIWRRGEGGGGGGLCGVRVGSQDFGLLGYTVYTLRTIYTSHF